MPPAAPHLIPEDLAAYVTGRPASTIRRWATEGRITRHPAPDRRNGVLYDVFELPAARRDPDTGALIAPAQAPPLPEYGDGHAAA